MFVGLEAVCKAVALQQADRFCLLWESDLADGTFSSTRRGITALKPDWKPLGLLLTLIYD